MPWIPIKPTNTGGGRRPGAATGAMSADGQLTLSNAACEMLGTPERVKLSIEPELVRIRLEPTTPTDAGGFSLSGGGLAPRRLRSKTVADKYPQLVGKYKVAKFSGGIELRKVIEE